MTYLLIAMVFCTDKKAKLLIIIVNSLIIERIYNLKLPDCHYVLDSNKIDNIED